jgi:hypothetical protein
MKITRTMLAVSLIGTAGLGLIGAGAVWAMPAPLDATYPPISTATVPTITAPSVTMPAVTLRSVTTAPAATPTQTTLDGTGFVEWDKACNDQFANQPGSPQAGAQYRSFAHPDGVKCGITEAIVYLYPNYDVACDRQFGPASYPEVRGLGQDGRPVVHCNR